MNTLKISDSDWEVLKVKLGRKYNSLTAEDLEYVAGDEQNLLIRLAKRLHRNVAYVHFTLAKELQDLASNRL